MVALVFHKFGRSVVLRITSMMISVILMAFISIFSSMYMSQISENDGKAINLSGSLRMMSYRITTQAATLQKSPNQQNQQKVQALIQRFETLFSDPVLKKDFIRFNEIELQQEYQAIRHSWQTVIKPQLANADQHFDLERFLPTLESFVENIDLLVYGYQQVLEERLALLKIIQTVMLSITLLLIGLSLYSIHRHIAQPLKALTAVAEASSKGDWSKRCHIEREDELGLLSQTINQAHDSIQAIHRDLEQRIHNKTIQLSRNNEILTFLYNVAQQVNQSHLGQLAFRAILEELCLVSERKKIELKLFANDYQLPYQHIIVDHQSPPEQHSESAAISTFIIERNNTQFGELIVADDPSAPLEDWQQNLLHSLVDQFAIALSLTEQLNQQRRIALLDERSIIARELHDSLAQSLSYLKIQVTRIEKGLQDVDVPEQVSKPVAELKEGLSSAYRQLRELLTTFRLQIGNGGLKAALTDTIKTLAERSDIDIRLDYDCTHVPFEPSEAIHILQITKEALQNAIKHSHGSLVSISLIEKSNKSIELLIKDNGIGIKEMALKLNHYGTEIMQERCHSLHGELTIRSPDTMGTEVGLTFLPNYLSKVEKNA